MLSSIRTVRSFARERAESDRYNTAVDRSYRLAAKRALLYGAFTGMFTVAGFGAIALVVWMGGRMVLTGEMSMGDLTAFLLYTLTVAASLSALSGLYADLMKAMGASERVFELLDRPLGLEAGGGGVLARPRGDVAFENVRFSYPTRPDRPVLDGFDLHIRAGEVIALVGPSGAGKSTIAALLARFYDPTSGRIAIDGTPLTTYEPGSLRAHIAMVAQEPVLFATTIEENIRYGRPGASPADIEAAAEAAHALEFISAFPEGMATPVGERGVQLSGGQKQRVAIARAILKDPAILVLDEATSALDSESEHLVQEALDRLMQGRTTLVIAHRLSTVRDADRVVVLEGGRVVEQGSHDALLARNGLYRRLVERQFEEHGRPCAPGRGDRPLKRGGSGVGWTNRPDRPARPANVDDWPRKDPFSGTMAEGTKRPRTTEPPRQGGGFVTAGDDAWTQQDPDTWAKMGTPNATPVRPADERRRTETPSNGDGRPGAGPAATGIPSP